MTFWIDSRDRLWITLLAGFFVFGLAASWQRWGNPVVDIGREMNQPLRLADGEMLYSDVRHIYGPLSPWLHAALFRLLGPSLTILYVDGILSAICVLALAYWLARQVMNPLAAGAATMNVMWLCVFKPAGNYILPYSYNALHGTALGLLTLAILVTALKRTRMPGDPDGRRPRASMRHDGPSATGREHRSPGPELRSPSGRLFLLAGILAGVVMVTKTEMGIATVAAGVTAAVLASPFSVRRSAALTAVFLMPVMCLTVAVYGWIAVRVGWSTLASDSWLLPYNMPQELAYFNSHVSGLADPLRSLGRMLIALAKLGIIAAVVAAISGIVATRQRPPGDGGRGTSSDGRATAIVSRPWRLLAAAVILLIVMSVTTGVDRDKGPYLAMPLLLVGFLAMLARDAMKSREKAVDTRVLICLTVYALASLARMILHVRSGGAYASYLLPVSIIIFMYLWVGPFAERFRNPRASRAARTIAVGLMLVVAIGNAGLLAFRYRTRNTGRIATARGTLITEPDIGHAFNEALAYLESHTRVGDFVAVMPEGTSLDFLTDRRNPLRDEITIPGALDATGEARAIQRLQDTGTRLVLITNRPTAEFGAVAFGRDYCQRLMQWIEGHYALCAIFGPVKNPGLQIGDRPFFIRAYCRR